jgi:hypothetical protein
MESHLLGITAQPGSRWLTHGSGHSSNSSDPKTEMENVHVGIPTWNYLLYAASVI